MLRAGSWREAVLGGGIFVGATGAPKVYFTGFVGEIAGAVGKSRESGKM